MKIGLVSVLIGLSGLLLNSRNSNNNLEKYEKKDKSYLYNPKMPTEVREFYSRIDINDPEYRINLNKFNEYLANEQWNERDKRFVGEFFPWLDPNNPKDFSNRDKAMIETIAKEIFEIENFRQRIYN